MLSFSREKAGPWSPSRGPVIFWESLDRHGGFDGWRDGRRREYEDKYAFSGLTFEAD